MTYAKQIRHIIESERNALVRSRRRRFQTGGIFGYCGFVEKKSGRITEVIAAPPTRGFP
ncbi:MAG: hypothetical protein ACLRSW_10675 [Christensenellaceae bacterium]